MALPMVLNPLLNTDMTLSSFEEADRPDLVDLSDLDDL